MVAQELFLAHPSSFASLALANTHAGGSSWSLLPSLWSVATLLRMSWTSDPRRLCEHAAGIMFSAEFLAEGSNREAVVQKLLRRVRLGGLPDPAASRAQSAAAMAHDTRSRLRAVRDLMVSPAHGRNIARETEASLHEAEGAGHQLNDDI
eukprot:m51a1_g12756 hypothetical protein (150) ;mRNA; f:417-1218